MYGMYSHGRNFYYYIYVPGRLLYTNTPVNMIVAFLACAVVLTLLLLVRAEHTKKAFSSSRKRSKRNIKPRLSRRTPSLNALSVRKRRQTAPSANFCSICRTTSARR